MMLDNRLKSDVRHAQGIDYTPALPVSDRAVVPDLFSGRGQDGDFHPVANLVNSPSA